MIEMDMPMSWHGTYPWLCVVKIGSTAWDTDSLGILYGTHDERQRFQVSPIVYLVNIGDVKKLYRSEEDFLTRCPKVEYKTWAELKLAWRID